MLSSQLPRRRGLALMQVTMVVLTVSLLLGASSALAGPLVWSSPSSIDTVPLFDVTCPSTTLCLAVDYGGNVLTSTNPTGGAATWTLTNVDKAASLDEPHILGAVSCPTLTLCVAVDNVGNVVTSTDPTGGAGAWTVTSVDPGNDLTGVSCPRLDTTSVQYCVAVDFSGNVVYTTGSPTGGSSAWATAHIDTPGAFFTGVSCAAFGSLCAAVDGNGSVLTSTEPTGGTSAWSAPVGIAAFANTTREQLQAISCPTTTFCAATDGYDYIDYEGYSRGDVITSTNPTGGAAAWSEPTQLAQGLFTISCQSSAFCLATDLGGNVFAATEPQGDSSAWGSTLADGLSNITGLSCPSPTLCVAVDGEGKVLTGTVAAEKEPAPEAEHPAGGGSGKAGGGGSIIAPSVQPPGGGPAPLTHAQLVALLTKQLALSAKAAKIGALLKRGGLSLMVQGLGAGALAVGWFVVPPGAKLAKQVKAKPVLVASGKLTLAAPGTGRLKLGLTAMGRRLLKHAGRLKLIAKGTFSPTGGTPVSAVSTFVLRR